MTLLIAGFWPTTFWCDRYWQNNAGTPNYQFWGEYAYVAPTGGDSRRYYYGRTLRQDNQKEVLIMVKTLLQALKET